MVGSRLGWITAPTLGAIGFFEFVLCGQGFKSNVLFSFPSSLLTHTQRRDATTVPRYVPILLAVHVAPLPFWSCRPVGFFFLLQTSGAFMCRIFPSRFVVVVVDCRRGQADAKRIYREMYILRHIRHNEIIHLRDVLMPADYENFRDLYLVSFVHTAYVSGKETLFG